MSEEDKKAPEEKGARRGRNLPLILLLVGLAMVAFLQMPDNGKTARITYAQFRYLGSEQALEDIEILHAPDNIKIEGKLNTERIQTLIREGNFSAEQKKNLAERTRYRVEGVLRREGDQGRGLVGGDARQALHEDAEPAIEALEVRAQRLARRLRGAVLRQVAHPLVEPGHVFQKLHHLLLDHMGLLAHPRVAQQRCHHLDRQHQQ